MNYLRMFILETKRTIIKFKIPLIGRYYIAVSIHFSLFVGYKGNLSPMHPDYALKRLGNEMALNLVDMDRFSPTYLDFNRKMFEAAFAFLDEYREKGYKILIHCNQGESRAPTLGMLYVARLGAYNYVGFEESVQRLRMVYPQYAPKNNIYQTVAALWQDFVKI